MPKKNKRELARDLAIKECAALWELSEGQAKDKFNHQDKKWQKKQVNKALREHFSK